MFNSTVVPLYVATLVGAATWNTFQYNNSVQDIDSHKARLKYDTE